MIICFDWNQNKTQIYRKISNQTYTVDFFIKTKYYHYFDNSYFVYYSNNINMNYYYSNRISISNVDEGISKIKLCKNTSYSRMRYSDTINNYLIFYIYFIYNKYYNFFSAKRYCYKLQSLYSKKVFNCRDYYKIHSFT